MELGPLLDEGGEEVGEAFGKTVVCGAVSRRRAGCGRRDPIRP